MLKDWWRHLFADDQDQDPIDHPALMRMTPDELADLPLWPLHEPMDASLSGAANEPASKQALCG